MAKHIPSSLSLRPAAGIRAQSSDIFNPALADLGRKITALEMQIYRVIMTAMSDQERKTKLDDIEKEKRRLYAEAFSSVPQTRRKEGKGKYSYYLHPDADRHSILGRFKLACQKFHTARARVHIRRARVRRGLTPDLPPLPSGKDIDMPTNDGKKPVADPRYQQQEADDMPLDRALETEMPFGKYSGLTLGEIIDEGKDGLSYMAWLKYGATINADRLRAAIASVYHHHSEECDDAANSW